MAVTEPRPIITHSAPIAVPALPAEFQPPSSHDRADRVATALVTLLPLVALAIVAPLAWGGFLHWSDLVVFVLCYVPTGLGITVGYHRLLTHRAFNTTPALRAIFTILGCMAIEGPPIEWVANHRKHHTYSDEEGDPHSPHVNFAGGLVGSLRGLWHAHLGWVFGGGMANEARYAPDLLADPVVRFVDRTFIVWVLAGLAIPFGLGWAISGGTIAGALTGLLWGGAVRVFLLHHVTFSINSLCHFFGRREFETTDHSTNLAWLAPFSFGESWHNNHHAFPRSAVHGLGRWQLDLSGVLIKALARVGLARDLVVVSAERQQSKRHPDRAG
ncbi:MAG TPA: fatty acid desaturase [Solirubrobacteraceae bacterium]|nr:fatty acid desaturase [Solirubrobacteraceae bacterium]